MKALLRPDFVPRTILILCGVVILLTLLIPREATLGGIIRIVLLHGALSRAGLYLFGVAGLLGLALLLRPDERLASWTLASQQTALVVWFLAALTSVIATYLSWGVIIAWGEPRTQSTAAILGLGLLMLAVVLWVKDHRFTGVTNVVLGVFAWLMVTRASSIQHPEQPIGSSPSLQFRVVFVGLVITLLVMAIQFVRWIRRTGPAPSVEVSAKDGPTRGT